MSSSTINKHHKNAVFNEYQRSIRKEKGTNKEEKGQKVIIDNIDD